MSSISKTPNVSPEPEPRGRPITKMDLAPQFRAKLTNSAENSPTRLSALKSIQETLDEAARQFGRVTRQRTTQAAVEVGASARTFNALPDNDKDVGREIFESFKDNLGKIFTYTKQVDDGLNPTDKPEHFHPRYEDADSNDVTAQRNLLKNLTGV